MNSPQVAVGAVVFNQNRVLLVKRKNMPAAGQWAIPGGKVRKGETLAQAAEREIMEETGIIIKAGKPVYVFELINPIHYVIIDLEAKYISGSPIPADDAEDADWVGLNELDKWDITESTLELIRGKCDFSPYD